MRAAAEKIGFLRASLARAGLEGVARVALGHAAADACLHGGIRQGALHEIFPAAAGDEAASGGFAAVLAGRAAAGRRVLWLRTDFAALEHGEVSPLGLLELGLAPARFFLLRAPDAVSLLRAAADALACRALGALVIEIPGTPKILDLSASRRLVLAAAQSGVTAFLLRLDAEPEASAAETRWLVRPARGGGKENVEAFENWGCPRFDAELVRNRHGHNGHWVMEWNCDEGLFRPADYGAVVSAPLHRPAAAENTKERIA